MRLWGACKGPAAAGRRERHARQQLLKSTVPMCLRHPGLHMHQNRYAYVLTWIQGANQTIVRLHFCTFDSPFLKAS